MSVSHQSWCQCCRWWRRTCATWSSFLRWSDPSWASTTGRPSTRLRSRSASKVLNAVCNSSCTMCKHLCCGAEDLRLWFLLLFFVSPRWLDTTWESSPSRTSLWNTVVLVSELRTLLGSFLSNKPPHVEKIKHLVWKCQVFVVPAHYWQLNIRRHRPAFRLSRWTRDELPDLFEAVGFYQPR